MNTPALPAPTLSPRPPRRGLVRDLVTGGGVTLLVGICLLPPAAILSPLMIPATICMACGASVALAGLLARPFIRRAATA